MVDGACQDHLRDLEADPMKLSITLTFGQGRWHFSVYDDPECAPVKTGSARTPGLQEEATIRDDAKKAALEYKTEHAAPICYDIDV